MAIIHHKLKRYHRLYLAISIFILLLISIIPTRLAIAFYHAPLPQAILTLGGGEDREAFTAQFAKTHPSLAIWVSSGTTLDNASQIFRDAGISNKRVHLDYRAADTVTNFTSLVQDFKSRKIQHLYLITSDFHMLRAKAIATLVLGSHGIAFTSVSVPSREPPESWLSILRDLGRVLVWLLTGRTGASLNPEL